MQRTAASLEGQGSVPGRGNAIGTCVRAVEDPQPSFYLTVIQAGGKISGIPAFMRDQDPRQISAVICDPAKDTEKIYKQEGEEEEQ